jgi:serine/threonine protein kinase
MMETRKLAAETVLQDRYRILSLLNRGGMGRVYLAEDLRFRSRVAVKEAYLTQEELRRAFAREAGLLHRLRHQVLPHVTDHFTEGEAQYLVMQLFVGKDLEELLAEKLQETGAPFAVNQVLRWADQLLDALQYLHSHQPPVVHRDIKPQNLKLTERGDVILLDFGLAKGAAPETSQIDERMEESLPGYTHHYAPLEQIRGTGTDPRSDLYALAATIYRLITGRLPSDALTRATAALERRPDPLRPANEVNGRVPEAVAAVLRRALAQLADERPASATEMRRALRAALQPQAPDDQAPDYYDTATSIEGSWIEMPQLSQEPATDTLGATKSSASEVTNAGRIVVPSSAPGVDEQVAGAAFGWSRLRGGWAVCIAVSLLLPVIAALAYWRLNPVSGSSAANPSARKTIITRPESSTPPPTPFVEAMRYYLQVESQSGRAQRVAGANPVLRGRWLKFHFVPSWSGYLYIIAPGEGGGRTTFLTAQPNSAWGVKGNLLAAGTDYSFPSRRDKWIEVARGASPRTYTIIFTPEPLAQPGFLAEAADRALTAAEEGQLAELRKRFGQRVRLEEQGTQSVVAIPAQGVSGAPFLFEINLRLGADKEGDQR